MSALRALQTDMSFGLEYAKSSGPLKGVIAKRVFYLCNLD